MLRRVLVAAVCASGVLSGAALAAPCGEVVTIATHDGTTTRYAFGAPQGGAKPAAVLVLLAGGGGVVNLDDAGCVRDLTGNSLVRMAPVFRELGFATAVVDAPSDHNKDEDGLRGFRSDPKHADDLGRITAQLRARTGAPVWIAGTSRGAISAVNAASRLKGAAAPDGVVVTSVVMVGSKGNKYWVRDTVFDHDLGAITLPTLIVGHALDKCLRSPPDDMERLAGKLNSARKQVATVTGGPGWKGDWSLKACAGRAPHGFNKQDREVAEGIARFLKGGRY
jgi:hypothetical protein